MNWPLKFQDFISALKKLDMKTKNDPKPNDDRSDVKNPNNPKVEKDKANTEKQNRENLKVKKK